jgi:hypothetical protein
MKRIGILVFLLGMTYVIPNKLFSQRIVWEKQFSISVRDNVKSIYRLYPLCGLKAESILKVINRSIV